MGQTPRTEIGYCRSFKRKGRPGWGYIFLLLLLLVLCELVTKVSWLLLVDVSKVSQSVASFTYSTFLSCVSCSIVQRIRPE